MGAEAWLSKHPRFTETICVECCYFVTSEQCHRFWVRLWDAFRFWIGRIAGCNGLKPLHRLNGSSEPLLSGRIWSET